MWYDRERARARVLEQSQLLLQCDRDVGHGDKNDVRLPPGLFVLKVVAGSQTSLKGLGSLKKGLAAMQPAWPLHG